MRHWNIVVLELKSHKVLCFYPTYEALKQDTIVASHLKLGSFYPTYEALKRIPARPLSHLAVRFLPYLWGIETQAAVPLCPGRLRVFTLPMRHWNPKNTSALKPK